MPRFVLLRHECPPTYKPSHWDLMLEAEGVLQTWELRELPTSWIAEPHQTEAQSITATRLPDHRLEYLDYEGPLTDNRGSVAQIDVGGFEIVAESPQRLVVILRGKAIRDTIELVQTAEENRWELRTCF